MSVEYTPATERRAYRRPWRCRRRRPAHVPVPVTPPSVAVVVSPAVPPKDALPGARSTLFSVTRHPSSELSPLNVPEVRHASTDVELVVHGNIVTPEIRRQRGRRGERARRAAVQYPTAEILRHILTRRPAFIRRRAKQPVVIAGCELVAHRERNRTAREGPERVAAFRIGPVPSATTRNTDSPCPADRS